MTEPMADLRGPPPAHPPPERFHPVVRVRKWLHWLGIENEHGLFSWRAMLLALGVGAFIREPSVWSAGLFLVAVVLHIVEGGRSQARTKIAMETAERQGSARMSLEAKVAIVQLELQAAKETKATSDELEAMRKEQAELREKVKLIATPERMEKLEQFFKKRLGA